MRFSRSDLMDVFTRFSIETPTVELRPVLNRDALEFARMFNADGGDFQKYTFNRTDEQVLDFGPSMAKYFMAHLKQHDEEIDAASLYVVRKQQGRPFIGRLRIWQDSENRPRIAPYLIPSQRGQGALTQLYEKVIGRGYAAGLFPDRKVVAEVPVENTAAQKFLISHEFKVSGAARPLQLVDDPKNGVMVLPFERELVLKRSMG